MRPRFVIVGASLAGGTAAATLRHEGFDGEVVLIGAETRLPYERPPMSKSFLRGETVFEDALVHPDGFWKDNEVELRLGEIASGIDTEGKAVTLATGERIAYDRLLITTGARNRRFPIPGLDLESVYDLRTVDDAERIRAAIAPGRRAVLGGMGFIGSEVAASLRRRGVEVTVVDGGPVPLARVLGEVVGGVLEGIHRDHGVRMYFNDQIAGFEGNAHVERVLTTTGRSLECDFAVIGLGVQPNVEIVQGTDIEVDNGVAVDELSRTNVADVFAAGDVANHYHPVFGRRLRVEHWQNAIRHGRAAAMSMLGKGSPYREIHWFWSEQYDQRIEYAGHHTEWDDLVVRGSLEARDFSAFYLKEGRVQAAMALNRGKDVRRATPIIEAGRPVDPRRLRDESVDLASMA